MDEVINNTDRMVAVNPVDKLALGYKAAKQFISDFEKWRKEYPVDSFLKDFERCKRYCEIIDGLKADGVAEVRQMKRYQISADGGASWTTQWFTAAEAEMEKNAGYVVELCCGHTKGE